MPKARAAVADDAIPRRTQRPLPALAFDLANIDAATGLCAKLMCQPEVLHAQAEDPPGRVGRRL